VCDVDESFVAENGNGAVCGTDRHRMGLGQLDNGRQPLETELHNAFAVRRLNHANLRREFFFATPEEVRDVLAEKVGNLLEYAPNPEAAQYYQSMASWPADVRGEPAR
jgi:hypothetical protein